MKNLKRVTISVNPDEYIKFEKLASESGLSTAWLIRKAMKDFMGAQEGKETIKIDCGTDVIKKSD